MGMGTELERTGTWREMSIWTEPRPEAMAVDRAFQGCVVGSGSRGRRSAGLVQREAARRRSAGLAGVGICSESQRSVGREWMVPRISRRES